MKKLLLLFVMLNLFQYLASAQNQLSPKGVRGVVMDSLLTALKTTKEDTLKVKILNDLSWKLKSKGDYKPAMNHAKDAKVLSEKVNFKKGQADSYNNIGSIYYNQGNYPQALKNHFASLKIREEIGDRKGVAASYNNIGIIYAGQGNYPEALKNYLASLKIREEIEAAHPDDFGNKKGIAISYNNIGMIYLDQSNYPEALKNHLASLKIAEEIEDKAGIANSFNNIGITYHNQGKYPEALKNFLASLKIFEEIGDKRGIAYSYNNIGSIYYGQGNYPEALKYHSGSLKIREEIANKEGIAASHINIGLLYTAMNKAAEGRGWLQKGLHLSREMGSLNLIKHSYSSLAEADSALGNYKAAFEHYKMYIIYRDSLINEENTKKIVQEQMQYEYDKKEAIARAEQEKKEALHKAELDQQTMQRNGFIGGFALMLALAGVSYRSYRTKRKAHAVITEQKAIVEQKNKDITDSITYAHNIQNAIMISQEELQNVFPEVFVLNKPRDIISGDFYWVHKSSNGQITWAVADCTGHGVPGALMSMIGNALLNEAVIEKRINEPADILDYVRTGIIKSFKEKGASGEAKDGMDMGLCTLTPPSKGAGGIIQYAGANNPLYLGQKQ